MIRSLFLSVMMLVPLTGAEMRIFDFDGAATKTGHRGFPGVPYTGSNIDWTSPVDYTQGTFYFRVQIRSMPTDQSMYLPLFFWQDDNESGPPPAVRKLHVFKSATAPYTATWSIPFGALKDYYGDMDWSAPRDYVRIAIKNSSSGNVTDRGDFDWSGEDPDDWYPMDMRYTAVLVSAGQTFSGWDNYIHGTYTADPVIGPDGGSFTGSARVTISSATSGARIFYTTDGTEPTDLSIPYTGPFILTSSRRIRARAFSDASEPSGTVQSERFLVSRTDGDVIVLEAEDMQLNGYAVDDASLSGQGIYLPAGTASGTARAVFNGPAGTYALTMYAVPENDGNPQVTVSCNGMPVITAQYPRNVIYGALTYRELYSVLHVSLQPGDTVALAGTADGNAMARVDRIYLQNESVAGIISSERTSTSFPGLVNDPEGKSVFNLPDSRNGAVLSVYNSSGMGLFTVTSAAGTDNIVWPGTDTAGVYWYTLDTGTKRYAGTIVRVR